MGDAHDVDRIFTSGGPPPGRRLGNWARTYRLPLYVASAFGTVVVAFVLLPDPGQSSPDRSPTPVPDVTPRPVCPACGFGERCDESTGICLVVEATPPTCVEGASYDPEEDRCVARAVPTPTPLPSKTLAPGATPRVPTPDPTPAPPPTPTPVAVSPPPQTPEP